MEPAITPQQKKDPIRVSWKYFLESVAPGMLTSVPDCKIEREGKTDAVNCPALELWCTNKQCGRNMMFDFQNSGFPLYPNKIPNATSMVYKCRHCKETAKTYALFIEFHPMDALAIKLGELPSFGPPIPDELLRDLTGEQRDWMMKGRRAENQGLGVGAYAYYRRVIESTRAQLLDRIIEVAKLSPETSSLVPDLQAAKDEIQFKKAIETTKLAVPPSLLIRGHNPLALLHSFLSDGIHRKSDGECLESAHSIRTLLSETSKKIASAMREDDEVIKALKHMHSRRNPNQTT
jgi:hypothetical protein